MKKSGVICLILVLLLCILQVSATENEESAALTNGCVSLDSKVPVLGNGPIVDNADAMVLYETNTDTLMYAYNADEPIAPASLVKIMTALIAIENSEMTDVVTVQESVLATLPRDALVVDLMVDEVLTVKDLLYCMMVASGNDAAAILADHVMGSQEAFVAELNRYAAELGCTNTHFTDAHGLDDDNQYTTARDIAKMLAHATQNEQFCELFGAVYYTVPATNKYEARWLSTQNYLLSDDDMKIYYDSRVTGSRTAITGGKRSLASTAKVGDMNLICIVIGSESVYESDGYTVRVFGGYKETKQLLDLGFEGYKAAQILHEGQVLKQVPVSGGSCDISYGTRESAFSVIPANVDTGSLVYRYVDETVLTAPIEEGARLATLQVWCGNICIAQTELYALNSVPVAASLVTNNDGGRDRSGFLTVVLYILGAFVVIALGGIVVLVLIRTVRIAKARKHSRRYRRSRRRSR